MLVDRGQRCPVDRECSEFRLLQKKKVFRSLSIRVREARTCAATRPDEIVRNFPVTEIILLYKVATQNQA